MGFSFTSLADAAGIVRDGASVAVTKFNPMAAVRELVRQGRKDLRLIGVPTAGFAVDLLVAAGCVRSIESGALVLGGHGAARNAARATASGRVTLVESACPLMEMQLRAGASGFSFTPALGMIGSDLMAQRPDLKIIEDPYDPGHDIVLAPSIRPDVAIIHGLRADPEGNVVTTIHNEDRLVVQAAHRAIATVEAVRDDALAHLEADEQVIPALYFDAIAVVPGGALPFACRGHYRDDEEGIAAYLDASRSRETMDVYVAALRASRQVEAGESVAV
jgi:glutaconate CoA-transferase, subunit A